ncbi:hypothetical protein TNCV_3535281 [Trichonephila clavipes]|nr:hypothetical protein TNCV_3535281 [Trichonephila clavipes]
MAPRTIDAAVVQKDSLRVDELLSKLVSLEEQLASLKLQRKSSRSHHHQRSTGRSKSRCRYNPQGKYCFYQKTSQKTSTTLRKPTQEECQRVSTSLVLTAKSV